MHALGALAIVHFHNGPWVPVLLMVSVFLPLCLCLARWAVDLMEEAILWPLLSEKAN